MPKLEGRAVAAVTVSRAADRLIAVKQVPAERAGDIEREAGVLKRLNHPGVVRLIDVVETPDRGRALHTEFVSSDTWATRPLTDPAERTAGVAALAGVVADLHDLGIAHCQLNPSHVLHGEDDRPVLCGLRLAAEASAENRHKDLVALAELCHDPALEPGPLVGKLSALADATRAGRLSARELSRRIDLLLAKRSAPAAATRAAGDGTGGRPRERSGRRSLAVVAAVLGASAAILAAGIWSRGGQMTITPTTITDGPAPPAAATASQEGEVARPQTVEAPDATGSVAAAPADRTDVADAADEATARADRTEVAETASPTAASLPTAMVPGIHDSGLGSEPSRLTESADGALSAATGGSLLPPTPGVADRESPDGFAEHESGAVLEHGGRTYAVGSPGDFVATGDWDCDGQPTPAIVRPSTGHVVLFDAWPAPAQSISMPVRWEVEAPTGAEAVAEGSCDLLRVYTPAGSRLFDPSESQ